MKRPAPTAAVVPRAKLWLAAEGAHGGGDGIRHLLPAYSRTALLQNSPAVVNGPVGVPPAFGRKAQTPSSPLNAISTAAATEGAQLAYPAPSADPAPTTEQQPVSLIETPTKLARDRAEEYNAKLKVFQAFCAKFEEAAKQFTTGPEREFAQRFADSFLDSWNQALTD
ncbi:hypothetical protein RAB80_017383, partial [Fusarium oxysporum f. sp. vasinfectum]